MKRRSFTPKCPETSLLWLLSRVDFYSACHDFLRVGVDAGFPVHGDHALHLQHWLRNHCRRTGPELVRFEDRGTRQQSCISEWDQALWGPLLELIWSCQGNRRGQHAKPCNHQLLGVAGHLHRAKVSDPPRSSYGTTQPQNNTSMFTSSTVGVVRQVWSFGW